MRAAEPTKPQLLLPSTVAGLDKHFAAASAAFRVPLPLLKAVGYVETRWQMVHGQTEFEGVAPAFGVMALRGQKLELGTRLAHVSLIAARTEPRANIFAGAALLRRYANAANLRCGALAAWQPVLARYSGITEPGSRQYYLREIERVVSSGVSIRSPNGIVASISPSAKVSCP